MKKEFYKSKTLVIATIALVLLFVDFFFPSVLPLDQLNEKLNELFVGSGDGIEGINFGTLFTIISMIALRFVTKKGLDVPNRLPNRLRKKEKESWRK